MRALFLVQLSNGVIEAYVISSDGYRDQLSGDSKRGSPSFVFGSMSWLSVPDVISIDRKKYRQC
jgi:hypothetical protein